MPHYIMLAAKIEHCEVPSTPQSMVFFFYAPKMLAARRPHNAPPSAAVCPNKRPQSKKERKERKSVTRSISRFVSQSVSRL